MRREHLWPKNGCERWKIGVVGKVREVNLSCRGHEEACDDDCR